MSTTPVVRTWAARCECYKNHNSSSGRCNERDVTDLAAAPGQAIMCARCLRECCPSRSIKIVVQS